MKLDRFFVWFGIKMLLKKKKNKSPRSEWRMKCKITLECSWEIAPGRTRSSSSEKVASLHNALCLSGDNGKPQRSHPLPQECSE